MRFLFVWSIPAQKLDKGKTGMQKRMYITAKQLGALLLSLLCCLLFLSVVPVMERPHDVHAYTAAQRPTLQPSDISVSRERILRSAKAHIDRANQVGYGYNNILMGSEYIPLASSTRKFCCVDLVTHVLYTATASKINGQYYSLADTLATSHAFANSNGLVFDTSSTSALRQQLIAMPQLYTRHVAPVDKTQLRIGDIVISGDRDAMNNPSAPSANTHTTLVIGKVTPEENAYLQIPNYNANTSYFITMSSSRGAEWVSTNQYNREWNSGDPNKGYFISNMFRLNEAPVFQDYGGFRIKKADAVNGAGLTGAEFTLESPLGDVLPITMTSSEYTYPKELQPGTYTLTETKAPSGYTLDPTPRTIEIEMDTINSVYWNTPITNAPSDAFLQVTKKDAGTGANVAGAVFDLSQSSTFPAGSTVRLTTRADGTTVPQRFNVGAGTTVYVREVSVPAPYLRDTTIKQVTLQTNQTVGVTFENNRAEGRIELTKHGVNNTPLQGAVFQVRNASNALVATLTTNAQGKAQTGLLPLGTYSVTETSVPTPYILDPSPVTINLSYKDMNTPVVVATKTISNVTAQGRIELTKQGTNNAPVQGAVFQVRNASNTLVATLTTNAQGKAQTGLLPLGTYSVTETSVPAPYILNATPFNMTLSYKDMHTPVVVATRTVSNAAAQGRIELTKQGTNNAPVQGAVFQVRNSANTLVATLTTNAQGKAQTGILPLGTYTVTETSVPSPYILNATPFNINVSYKDMNTPVVVATKTVSNAAAQGRLELTKRGTNNAPVQGAVFQVRNSANTVVATITTNAQGKAQTGLLPLGTYSVRETSVPSPYILDATPFNMTLTYKDMHTPVVVTTRTVTNEAARGRLELTKQNEDNEPVQGAVYQVRNAAKTVVATITTNAQGKAQTGLLPLGTYTVTETFVPAPYLLDTTPFNMTLTYKDMHTPVVVTTKTVTNEAAQGRIKIIKRDSINQELLANAIFDVHDAGNVIVDTITTDTNGVATSISLPLGDYTVTERTPPEGYLPNTAVHNVTLTYKDMHTPVVEVELPIENVPIRGKIRIIKLAKGDATPIEGATFELFNPDDTPAVDLYGNTVGTLTTDVDGMAVTPYLRYGTYILRETDAPDAFLINDEDFEVKIIHNEVVVNQYVRNERVLLRLRINKSDTLTGDPIQGVEFQVYDENGDLVTFTVIIDGRPVTVDRLITNDEGIAISAGVFPTGTYTLKEVKVPEGYASLDDITFEINRDTVYVDIPLIGKTYDELIGNAPTVIELSKKKITGDAELPGAHLRLIEKASNAIVDEWVSTDTPHTIRRLKVGVTYILRETLSPAGYTVATDVEFTVLDTGNVQPVVMRNKLTRIEIHKKDNVTGEALHGVKFRIQDKDKNAQRFVYDTVLTAYVREAAASTGNSPVLTTNTDGSILVLGLPIGDYELVETKESPGYKRLRDPVAFTVKETSDNTSPVVINLENEKNEVILEKTDLAIGEPVAGAVIQICNEENVKVYEVATDANGQAMIVGLPAGTYTFKETLAPDGYILNEETFTFTIDPYGDVSGVTEFTNEPTALTIVKEDIEDGIHLEGAVFEVYRLRTGEDPELMRFRLEGENYIAVADGEITTVTSNAEGTINILRLPHGEYRLVEITAPSGYVLDPTPLDVVLDDKANTTVKNDKTEITLEKTDLVTGEPVPGAIIQIFDEAGDLVREVTTDENGQALIKGLPAGTYTFKETLAPDGYILNEETFTFTIDAYGEVSGVTKLTNHPTSFLLYKRDTDDASLLEGAVFELYRLGEGKEPELMRFRFEGGLCIASADGEITRLVVDELGMFQVLQLPYGDYHLVEVKAPTRYALDPTPHAFTLDEQEGELELNAINSLLKVTLEKTDLVTGEPVAGAVIQIRNKENVKVYEVATDANGQAKIEGIPPGAYTFKEVLVPEGYIANDETFTFSIDSHGEVSGTTEFTNEPTSLAIVKEDAEDGRRLKGAVFKLYRLRAGEEPELTRFRLEDGTYVADKDGRFTTICSNSDGEIVVLRLPNGDYRLVETMAPSGYVLDPTPRDFALDGKSSVKVENRQTEVTLEKADLATGEPVAGAVIQIFDEKGVRVREVTTDENGQTKISGLPAGTYSFKELFAPDGYVLNEESFTFTIDELGDVSGVTEFTNEPTKVSIYKVDANQPDKKLPGVKFDLYRLRAGEDPELMRFRLGEGGVYIADADGELTTLVANEIGAISVLRLPYGDYRLMEIETLPGYFINSDGIVLTLNEKCYSLEHFVRNRQTEITLKKTDLVTGEPVAGAIIQIFDDTGEMIHEVTTDEDGRTELKGLRAGTYTFREILAPEGYILNEETFTFTIDAYGNVSGTKTFTNEPTSLAIVKEDMENGRRLEGATFELYRLRDGEEPELMRFREESGLYIADATGDLAEVVSDEDGAISIMKLPCGDYRLIETEAPKGYDRNEQGVDVTLTDDGETLTVTLLNNATQPPAKTGETFPLHAIPFLGLAVVFLTIVLFLRRRREE